MRRDRRSRLNLRLPAQLRESLERAASRTGRSLATVVRAALEDYLEREADVVFLRALEDTHPAVRSEDLALVAIMEGPESK